MCINLQRATLTLLGYITMRHKIYLACMFIWIWSVSMMDHYLTIKLSKTINEMEKNPLGQYLLAKDNGSVALFMTAKMAGLWIICLVLISLYKWRPKYALFSAFILSAIQLMLVFYFLQ